LFIFLALLHREKKKKEKMKIIFSSGKRERGRWEKKRRVKPILAASVRKEKKTAACPSGSSEKRVRIERHVANPSTNVKKRKREKKAPDLNLERKRSRGKKVTPF